MLFQVTLAGTGVVDIHPCFFPVPSSVRDTPAIHARKNTQQGEQGITKSVATDATA